MSEPGPTPIEFATVHEGGTLTVRGEIDLATAGRFREAVETALASSGNLIVDLSDVTFMDSTGLRALLQARERTEVGRRLTVEVADGGAVDRLLKLAGVKDLF